ncbi:MAG: hypothetical protein RIM23_12875, partial [Coleofasciculus sp. G3-WIS-01]|uniref:hypothetical protein n=1 Tax=Coleofasciculus sp. G3-WIS-01 TaxID=3069528 RepID=UPI0032FA0FE2
CIYITTIVERYPNYLTGEFIRYLDGSLGFISQLKSVGAFTHRLNGKKHYQDIKEVVKSHKGTSQKRLIEKLSCTKHQA